MKINYGMIIIIILLILFIYPILFYVKKSPYMLLENFKNNNNNYSSLMFKKTPFKPECCPNTYSNSMGCACMSTKQYNYLINRGGNNVPYSEY
jgi:hypothetical protein